MMCNIHYSAHMSDILDTKKINDKKETNEKKRWNKKTLALCVFCKNMIG